MLALEREESELHRGFIDDESGDSQLAPRRGLHLQSLLPPPRPQLAAVSSPAMGAHRPRKVVDTPQGANSPPGRAARSQHGSEQGSLDSFIVDDESCTLAGLSGCVEEGGEEDDEDEDVENSSGAKEEDGDDEEEDECPMPWRPAGRSVGKAAKRPLTSSEGDWAPAGRRPRSDQHSRPSERRTSEPRDAEAEAEAQYERDMKAALAQSLELAAAAESGARAAGAAKPRGRRRRVNLLALSDEEASPVASPVPSLTPSPAPSPSPVAGLAAHSARDSAALPAASAAPSADAPRAAQAVPGRRGRLSLCLKRKA